MDRFDAMRAFVQVVDSGSYTKAALQLNLHKATVSQQIQQLEDKLGTRLLTRTTRSVTPTAEGLAYYQHACAILQQVDEVESHAAQGHQRAGRAPARRRAGGHGPAGVRARDPRLPRALSEDHDGAGLHRPRRRPGAGRRGLRAARRRAARFAACPPAASAICALRCAPRRTTSSSTACRARPRTWSRHHQIGYVLASTARLRPVTA